MAKVKQQSAHTLHDLLITKMRVLYDVENTLVKALPKMAKSASNRDLKSSINSHLAETKNHVKRLEEGFRLLNIKPTKLKGDAISGLVKDADWVIKNVKGKEALDANLIAAAQYVEHYEIAGYGSALAWANHMNHKDVAKLLLMTLNEEKGADTKLSGLATSKVNKRVKYM